MLQQCRCGALSKLISKFNKSHLFYYYLVFFLFSPHEKINPTKNLKFISCPLTAVSSIDMPKKFVGENSKAAAARVRKDAAKKEQQLKKQKEIEDELWKDDDKHVLKKQQRKEEKEKKKQEQLEKKQASKILLETEMNSIKSAKPEPVKITRSQIATMTNEKKTTEKSVQLEEPLCENLNRLQFDGEEARTVDEAIDILSSKPKEVDLHPERRLKAAFAAFEAANLERLKAEYPTLRLSQVKQILRKEWMKSPDNPLNNL